MSNFTYWKEQIADMPEKGPNGWVDLETGLEFDPSVHYKTGGKTTQWKPSQDIKRKREIARFYGGKALTGTTSQKTWAETIRAQYLETNFSSDEEKKQLLGLGGLVKTSKFWILNREALSLLNKDAVLAEGRKIVDLIDKHYDTLCRTGEVGPKESAKEEIYNALKSEKVKVGYTYSKDIPNFEPFDSFGELLEMEMKNGRLQEVPKRWGR